jgi:hypothetical protein
MIVEGNRPNYGDVIESADLKGRLVCGHDFWEQTKLLDYGDVILCQRCGQYFTKIKHLMWIIKGKEIPNPAPPVKRAFIKPKQNHKEMDVWVRVPVRITDAE